MERDKPDLSDPGPYDTPLSSATRFGIEIVAWVAAPWAAAEIVGSAWATLPVFLILLALPALFNTPGDENVTGIATPGPIRILIEMLLIAVAIVGTLIVWPHGWSRSSWCSDWPPLLPVFAATAGSSPEHRRSRSEEVCDLLAPANHTFWPIRPTALR